MTNNEPLSGDLSNDSNADGTAGTTGAAAHRATGDAVPVDANDRSVSDDSGLGGTTSNTSDTGALAGDAAGDRGGDARDANLGDLGDPAHPFDQTNGIVEGLEGDSEEADGDDPTPA